MLLCDVHTSHVPVCMIKNEALEERVTLSTNMNLKNE